MRYNKNEVNAKHCLQRRNGGLISSEILDRMLKNGWLNCMKATFVPCLLTTSQPKMLIHLKPNHCTHSNNKSDGYFQDTDGFKLENILQKRNSQR